MISFFNTDVQNPSKVLSIYESALKDAQEKIKELGLDKESNLSQESELKPLSEISKNWKSYIWALIKSTLIDEENTRNFHQFPLKDLFDIRVGILDTSKDPILIEIDNKEERALCIRPSSFDENNRLRSIDQLLKEENELLLGRKDKHKVAENETNTDEEISEKKESKNKDKFLHEQIIRREDYIMLNRRETKGFSMLKSSQNENRDSEITRLFGKPLVISHHFIRLRPKKIALSMASVDFLHILLDIIIEGHVSSTNLTEKNNMKINSSSLNKTLQESMIQIPSDESGRKNLNQICTLYHAFEEIEEITREAKKHFFAALYKQILQNGIIT